MGRLFTRRVKNRVYNEIVDQGYDPDIVWDLVDERVDEETIKAAAVETNDPAIREFVEREYSRAGGGLLERLIEFLKSPQGQLLIDIIVKALVAALIALLTGS